MHPSQDSPALLRSPNGDELFKGKPSNYDIRYMQRTYLCLCCAIVLFQYILYGRTYNHDRCDLYRERGFFHLSRDAPKENTIAMVPSQNIGTGSQECRDNIPMTRCEYRSQGQGSVRCNACKNQNIITMIKININLVLLIIIRTSIIIFSIIITIITTINTSHRTTANGDHNVE